MLLPVRHLKEITLCKMSIRLFKDPVTFLFNTFLTVARHLCQTNAQCVDKKLPLLR